ncbi:MAG: hypothetical protein Q9216_006713 [Gyalolechia sp. 2 TL-2023]
MNISDMLYTTKFKPADLWFNAVLSIIYHRNDHEIAELLQCFHDVDNVTVDKITFKDENSSSADCPKITSEDIRTARRDMMFEFYGQEFRGIIEYLRRVRDEGRAASLTNSSWALNIKRVRICSLIASARQRHPNIKSVALCEAMPSSQGFSTDERNLMVCMQHLYYKSRAEITDALKYAPENLDYPLHLRRRPGITEETVNNEYLKMYSDTSGIFLYWNTTVAKPDDPQYYPHMWRLCATYWAGMVNMWKDYIRRSVASLSPTAFENLRLAQIAFRESFKQMRDNEDRAYCSTIDVAADGFYH